MNKIIFVIIDTKIKGVKKALLKVRMTEAINERFHNRRRQMKIIIIIRR